MKKDVYDLTNPQKAIYLTDQFYEGTCISNICGTLLFKEKVDFNLLEKALNIFVQKNDAARIKVFMDNTVPKQYIEDYSFFKVDLIEVNNEEELKKLEEEIVSTPFDLFDSFLFRFTMVKLPDGTGGYNANCHHMISDAWSMKLIIDEVANIYAKLINNETFNLDPEFSYIEHINKEQEYIGNNTFIKDKEYWETLFKESPEPVSFKEGEASPAFERKEFQFDNSTIEKVSAFCNQNKISQFIFFLSIYSIYFRNVLNSKNFMIGTPTLNRSNYYEKNSFGLFICTHPFVINIDDNDSFIDSCLKFSTNQRNMYRHLKYPFNFILEYIRKKHNTSDKLFDMIFSYQNARTHSEESHIPSSSTWIPNKNQVESLMIHMKDIDNTGNLFVDYDYLIDVFSEKEIIQLHNRILKIVDQVLVNNSIKLNQIEIIDNEEKEYLINYLNDTYMEYDKNLTIIDMFEEQVKNNPNNIAVTAGETNLTYKELNNRANIVANELKNMQVKSGDIIGLMLNRNENIIITILGILKLGATYMPIDPDYPQDRIDFMLSNSNTTALVTTTELSSTLKYSKNFVYIDKLNFNIEMSNPEMQFSSDSLAYIMYTSGSTGTPKAVSIQHFNVINFVKSMQKRLNYVPTPDNIVLSVTTMCFDIFVFEVFPTLLSGLHLVIANEFDARSPELLSNIIINKKISKILTTPSRMKLLFFDKKYLESLKYLKEIILGGEPFPKELLLEFQKITDSKIYNLYGPTETTVYSAFKDLTNEKDITIGKPIENTQIYVLNENNKLMPPNCIGEICIGGDGVGSGYYKNEELTNKAFIKNPYKENDIIYRTGDLGKWIDNEELICLGRKDFQIKIRGYRVELGDIASNILTFPNIDDAVVIDKEYPNGEKYLCGYIVSNTTIDFNELHKHLITKIPNYMVPSYFMQIDKIPLNLNHKVDRKALPTPTMEVRSTEAEYVAPKNNIEKILCDLIAEQVKIPKIGITNDIFEYPIDSLGIIEIQTKLIPYSLRINTQDFYKYRTIENIVKNINTSKVVEHKEDDSLYSVNDSFLKHPLNLKSIEAKTYNNILLIGSTGFLGMHLLKTLLDNTNSNITCLIRAKNNTASENRFFDLFNYYFKDCQCDLNRVEIINSDVTKENFGLDESSYNQLCNSTDLVINTAANVKYYGDYLEFRKINVELPAKLIDFCMANSIEFAHVSTLGVSGNFLVENKNQNTIFTENDFYIGQNYDQNVYIKTKFEAEKMIYEKSKHGLKATIFRVGNLTGRKSDGCFQKNIADNAFYNMLNLIINYKLLPKSILNSSLEFTPIDCCSFAIYKLLFNYNVTNIVFHILNTNLLPATKMLEYLKEADYKISVLEDTDFSNELEKQIKLNSKGNLLKGFINNFDKEKGLFSNSIVEQKNEFTNKYLNMVDFEWSHIDYNYFIKILKNIKEDLK